MKKLADMTMVERDQWSQKLRKDLQTRVPDDAVVLLLASTAESSLLTVVGNLYGDEILPFLEGAISSWKRQQAEAN